MPRRTCGYGASLIGGRAEQQDAYACLSSKNGKNHLLVVADGMGGHQNGTKASETVIAVARDLWRHHKEAPTDPHGFLETLCQDAHAQIRSLWTDEKAGPMSTIAALVVTPAGAWWAHVGDTRLYALRNGKPVFRTDDHTPLTSLVLSGSLTDEERKTHPDQNKLLRALGSTAVPKVTHGKIAMTPDTGFLLCTDGFWSAIDDRELPALFESADPQLACQSYAELATKRAGEHADNATVALFTQRHATASTFRTYWPIVLAILISLTLLSTLVFR